MPAALPACTPLTLSSITSVRGGLRAHLRRRVKKEIRRRLAVPDHLRCVEPRAEMRPKAGDIERERDSVDVAGRGHAERRGEPGDHRPYPGDRLERSRERLQHTRLQSRQEAIRHDLPEITVVLLDRPGAAPEKQLERLLLAEREAEFGQHLGQAPAAQELAIDEHACHNRR
ncbi:hypothetical protein BRDID11002_01760 [Bradyrhizobium diazoefficiens]